MKKIKAFTLAEIIIVLVILGIIAAMTMPTLIKHQQEVAKRTKIKKDWSLYDQVVQRMVVENDLVAIGSEDGLETNLKTLNGFASSNNCENGRKYFKIAEESKGENASPCRFKLSDGMWFDISVMSKPIISLKYDNLNLEMAENADDDTAFVMSTIYDSKARAFIVNKSDNEANKKLLSYIEKDKNNNNDSNGNDDDNTEANVCTTTFCKWKNGYVDYSRLCSATIETGCTAQGYISNKSVIDDNGREIAWYVGCNSDFSVCDQAQFMDYDANGNKIFDSGLCDGDINHCDEHSTQTNTYDEHNNKTSEYYGCDVNGENCYGSEHWTYDKNNNKTSEYLGCDTYGKNCRESSLWSYKDNGDLVYQYEGCDGNGENCSSYTDVVWSDNNYAKYYYDCSAPKKDCSYCYDSNWNFFDCP